MFFTLLLATIVILLLYIKIKYFTLRGPIPGSSPHFLFGNLIESGRLFGGLSLPEAFLAFRKRFGGIFQFWIGPTRVIAVGNVSDVQHIFNNRKIYDQGDTFIEQTSVLFPSAMVSLRGPEYKRHAAVISPLLRPGKIVSNFQLILDCTDRLLNNWRKRSPGKIHTDIVQESQKLSLGIFGYIGFDYDFEMLNEDANEKTNELARELQYKMDLFEIASFSPRFLSMIYANLSRRYRRSQAIIEKYLNQIVNKELKESPESTAERKRTCLIASLVSSLQQDEKAEATKNEQDKKGLSRSEIFSETVAMMSAAFDTTSSALSWFIHLMSKHPQVQQKLKAELRENGDNEQLTLDQIDSFVYLDCVIKEVLRFRPPIFGTLRTLMQDDRLPESGFQLHKGDTVFIAAQNLAYDTRYWSIDPELFYPERFLNEDKNHHPYAFIPFGGGHRQCVGRDLARFELKVVAARLMQSVTFGDGGSTINAGDFTGSIIKPKHVGVTITFD